MEKILTTFTEAIAHLKGLPKQPTGTARDVKIGTVEEIAAHSLLMVA